MLIKLILILKHNELFVKHTIKNEIRQSLSKYNHEHDIHVDEKQ